jgi:hypothetical protein
LQKLFPYQASYLKTSYRWLKSSPNHLWVCKVKIDENWSAKRTNI